MWKKILTVTLIFAFSVVGLVALSLFSFQRFDNYITYSDEVNRHYALIKHLNNLRVDLVQIENAEQGFLLYDDSTYYQTFHEEITQIKESFLQLYKLTESDPDQNKLVRS